MPDEPSLEPMFEDMSKENGMTYWWASDFMAVLGYPSMSSFEKAIARAIKASLAIDPGALENFQQAAHNVNGEMIADYKLSRFGCYMVAMNADIKKPQVAQAQVFFAKQAEQISKFLAGAEDVDRLLIRDEIKVSNVQLNSAAKAAGVNEKNYGFFHDQGYRGLYNKSLKQIAEHKGIKNKAEFLDCMGRTELAANLFRVTMTEERLKTSGIKDERSAMQVHKQVGKTIRGIVKDNTGVFPEDLPPARRLKEISKDLKKVRKQLNGRKRD